MTKTKRDYLKRKVAEAYYNIEDAGNRVLELMQVFQADHEDLATVLENIAGMMAVTQNALRAFFAAAWGKCPTDLSVWRH